MPNLSTNMNLIRIEVSTTLKLKVKVLLTSKLMDQSRFQADVGNSIPFSSCDSSVSRRGSFKGPFV